MKFTSVPENYAFLDGGLVYALDFGERRAAVDVEIIDVATSQVIAVCRFSDTDRAVIDVAPYVRRLLDPRPVENPSTSLRDDAGRTASIRLAAEGYVSPVRKFSSLCIDGAPRIISTMPFTRTISFGEVDELPLYAPDGGSIELTVSDGGGTVESREFAVAPSSNARVFVVDTSDFSPAAKSLEVRFSASGREETVRYRVVPRMPEAMRLAWTASSGAVEYYTFPTRRRRTLTVDKSRFCGEQGHAVTGLRAESQVEMVSDYEPAAMIECLEEILSAPRVWQADVAGCLPVDAVSTSTVRNYDGALNSVTVTVRAKRREELL